jgi:hypothetical protein
MQLNPLPNTNPRAAAFQMCVCVCVCVCVVNEFLDVYRANSEDDDEYKPQVDVSNSKKSHQTCRSVVR